MSSDAVPGERSDWPQEQVDREVRPAPDRYRNVLGKYKIDRLAACRSCGRCVEVCRYGVHVKPAGYAFTLRPKDHLCIGPECAETEGSCIAQCPQKALAMRRNPSADCMGDPRWSSDLILSTWHEAATGHVPPPHLESPARRFRRRVRPAPLQVRGGGVRRGGRGRSGRLGRRGTRGEAVFASDASSSAADQVDTGLDLNRRADGRPQVHIDIPVYGGGMSFGSVSIHTILAKARAAAAWNSFTCTGEGGYHDRLRPYDDHVITQVATGLFGVREETIQRVRIVEFKYAQGAKPGLGGHLLGDKNTPPVARMREAVAGNALFSPFPFHSVYSVEDHKKHVDWIKEMNPDCLVSVKVSTPTDVDMVAVGSYYAGAHIVHLDGSYGGTGAAPDIAKKNIAMPIEYAIPKVHKFLVAEGIRDHDHADRFRRDPHGLRRAEGHRPGRRRRGDRHGRDGRAGLRALRLLRERPRLPARHRHDRPRTDDADEPRVGHPAPDQSPERLARADGGRAHPLGDDVHRRTARPRRPAVLHQRRADRRRAGERPRDAPAGADAPALAGGAIR